MKDEKIIMRDSPEAASIQTVTGWVSRRGRLFGPAGSAEAENMARFDGATHFECTCGKVIAINGYCIDCHAAKELEKYNKMERKEWNGTDALYSQVADEYFFDMDDLMDHCEENQIQPPELRLVICVPSYAYAINPVDIYEGDLPEDGEVPREVEEAFEELNDRLAEQKTILSWFPGKFAAITPVEVKP